MSIFVNINGGLFYIPGTQKTSIFEGQPPKTRPKFQSKKGQLGSRYAFWQLQLTTIEGFSHHNE